MAVKEAYMAVKEAYIAVKEAYIAVKEAYIAVKERPIYLQQRTGRQGRRGVCLQVDAESADRVCACLFSRQIVMCA